MPTCPKCGADTNDDDQFCRSCGAPLAVKTSERPVEESYARERETCFGARERRRDISGLISFGIFLIVVAITFLANPNLTSDLQSWIAWVAEEKTILSRPPQGVISSATLFFGLLGISDFLVAGVRFAIDKHGRRAFADVLSGIALLLLSYLIYLYGSRALAWPMVLVIGSVACGLLVVLYGVVLHVFPKKTQ